MKTFDRWSAVTRIAGPVVLLAVLLPGCDQIQDLVPGDEGSQPAGPAASSPAAPTAKQPVAAQPVSGPPAQPVADDPAAVLAAFRELAPSTVTEAALQRVADIPEAAAEIESLDLSGASVSRGMLGLLARFPNLRMVRLTGVRSPPGNFSGFSAESTFEEIELDGTTIDDAGLEALSTVKTLRRLNLASSADITPAGFIPLGGLAELTDLDLSGTRVNDQMAPVLAQLPLVRLHVTRTAITDQGLVYLAKIKTLEDLELSFCSQVSGVGFRVFKGARLKRLGVSQTRFGVEGLAAIRGMKSLEYLNLFAAGIVEHTRGLVFGSLTGLKTLIMGNNQITDLGMSRWFKGCRSLEELRISGHKTVSDQAMQGLITLKNLRHLDCAGTSVTARGAAWLKERIPGVEVTIGSGERL